MSHRSMNDGCPAGCGGVNGCWCDDDTPLPTDPATKLRPKPAEVAARLRGDAVVELLGSASQELDALMELARHANDRPALREALQRVLSQREEYKAKAAYGAMASVLQDLESRVERAERDTLANAIAAYKALRAEALADDGRDANAKWLRCEAAREALLSSIGEGSVVSRHVPDSVGTSVSGGEGANHAT